MKSSLNFSRGEINGICVLGGLILLLGLVPYLYVRIIPEETFRFEDFKEEIRRFEASEVSVRSSNGNGRYAIEKTVQVHYFPFDPNSIDKKAWQALGIREFTARIILNFLNKRGHFFKKEDLKKIYSITEADYHRLEPYIEIKGPAYSRPVEHFVENRFTRPVRKARELNTADSAALDSLTGIGPAFALRIIRYRERLGGFFNKEQLREVFGIDSAKFEEVEKQIYVDPSTVKKININSAVFDDLRRMPYLNFKQINAIIQYRKQHGPFGSVDDLLKTDLITPAVLSKVSPYFLF